MSLHGWRTRACQRYIILWLVRATKNMHVNTETEVCVRACAVRAFIHTRTCTHNTFMHNGYRASPYVCTNERSIDRSNERMSEEKTESELILPIV